MNPTSLLRRAGRRLLFSLGLAGLLSSLHAGSVMFNYTLPAAATTSAGVFAADGTLLRTLWSNQSDPAGANSAIWNGLDDNGHPLAAGAYTVKVLHSQIGYTWQGTLGNTSTAQTGLTVRRAYYPIHDLAITGTNMLFSVGYNEVGPVFHRSGTATPNSVDSWGPADYQRSFELVATDGNRMYLANRSNRSGFNTFIAAFNLSDNSHATFSSGSSDGGIWTSVIDKTSGPDNTPPTGLAVQPTAGHLFVAHEALDEVRAFNKTTGASVSTTAITAPGKLAVTTDNTGLWVICTESGSRVVRRYSVDSSGNLSATTAVITGLSAPLALAVSPDNNTLLVADGGTSQQVKAFANVSSGTPSALWTLGQAGGYNATNGPDVANDKFYFMLNNQGYAVKGTYLAFQSDGSFWVGDPGNERSLRFSAGRVYLDRIMYLSHNYVSTTSVGEPARVFARGWLEFTVDYSQPVTQGWTLVRNWAAGMPEYDVTLQDKNGLHTVVKMSNGRTYGVANTKIGSTETSNLYELTSTGLRFCQTLGNKRLHDDGSLRWATETNSALMTYYRQAHSGFDGSNNPTWSAQTTLATTPITSHGPKTNTGGRGAKNVLHPSTSTGLMIVADGRGDGSYNFHLGAIAEGGAGFKWMTARGARYFDGHGSVGAYSWYPCNNAYVWNRHILLGCHGEGYVNPMQNTEQAGQFLHYWDNGLMIGQFGSPFNLPFNSTAVGVVAGQAGNAFCPAFASVGSDLYLWVNDEFGASGLHRWKINNPSTVAEITTSVNLPVGSNGGGLTGEFFSGTNFDTLVTVGNDASVNFNWGAGSPGAGIPTDNFSVRWSGLVEPLYTETYTFTVAKEDNARLWINGTLVADGWTTTGASVSGTFAMTAGQRCTLLLEYRETTGNASVSLKWQSTSQALQVIPYQQLFPSEIHAYNQGGATVGRFMTDPQGIPVYSIATTSTAITTTGLYDPAPQSVLQNARTGGVDFGLLDLEPFTNYRVRAQLAEISYTQGVGQRVFKAFAPATYPNPTVDILTGIDIFASAGGGYKAVTKEFVMTTDNAGHLRLGFTSGPGAPLVNAVEVFRDTTTTAAAYGTVGTGNGLKGEYFSDITLTTLAATRIDPEINFVWTGLSPAAGVPNANYSVRWTGKLLTAEAGTYTFFLNHDNGGRLWVNGTLLIDQWGTTGNHSATITLGASTQYDIKIEYHQTTGAGNVLLSWRRPTLGSPHATEIVPRSQLYTDYTPPAPVEVIVDNTDATGVTLTGAWVTSTGSGTMGTFYGINHCHDFNALKGSKNVRFTPTLPSAGTYEVFVRWTTDASRATNVPLSITHSGGTANFAVNQQLNGGAWVSFGTYTFTAGTAGYVVISNTGTTGFVDADAVRFVKP